MVVSEGGRVAGAAGKLSAIGWTHRKHRPADYFRYMTAKNPNQLSVDDHCQRCYLVRWTIVIQWCQWVTCIGRINTIEGIITVARLFFYISGPQFHLDDGWNECPTEIESPVERYELITRQPVQIMRLNRFGSQEKAAAPSARLRPCR